MTNTFLELTCRDPIIARDGRPFGVGQGNRMRSLPWLLPSVVAGSFRTALVKANLDLDFSWNMPERLLAVKVAGVFPTTKAEVTGEELYLPAPNDCVWDESNGRIHRVQPVEFDKGEGVDFPINGPNPVRLTEDQAKEDFKAKSIPAWWPMEKYTEWLIHGDTTRPAEWFGLSFLTPAIQETREHVALDPGTGAAVEGQLFATTGLNLTHMQRFSVKESQAFKDRFTEIRLTARVTISDSAFDHVEHFKIWHPLGGERRLVHWQRHDAANMWQCPGKVRTALEKATRIRMILATPAIFEQGWKPGWLDADTLTGTPPIVGAPTLKLTGVSIQRWKAVSGWSLAKIDNAGRFNANGKPGPKPIRRMVPAGGVYFFENVSGESAAALAESGWLQPISDDPQDRNDGFGLAVWGTW